MGFIEYITTNYLEVYTYFVEHSQMTLIAVSMAIIIGIPFGILICYVEWLKKPVLGIANIIQSVPSMAILGLAIPFLGIGSRPAIIMVVLYSLLPIIKNTTIGISNLNKETLEAAKGIGLTRLQILFKVQIPLALPTIMAGVRISAVTSVGLLTIAAFVGGGGLGFLVYSGIRTMNNYQILSGAIPACILALLVDYVMQTLETMIVPKGIVQNKNKVSKLRKITICLVLVALLFNMYKSTVNIIINDKEITIAGKDYTEQEVLVHLIAQAIESETDIIVNKKPLLGSSAVLFQSMLRKDVDLYVEYTGTAYNDILKYDIKDKSTEEILETVKKQLSKKYNLIVLEPLNFNNTFTIATTQENALKYNLSKISDLKGQSNNLSIGTVLEFLNREDGLLGLKKRYNLTFKKEIGIEGSNRYTALTNNETQLVDAFSTDALIKKLNLVVLEDDLDFFPPYNAIPLVRKEVLEQYPEIKDVVLKLASHLNEEVMIDLNYQVDELNIPASTVAKEFLEKIKFSK